MATIPKHHRKQEGEGNNGVRSCRKENTGHSTPKQKGLSRGAVHPFKPFFTAAVLKGLPAPSPTHQATRSSAELALPLERFSNFLTSTFLAV